MEEDLKLIFIDTSFKLNSNEEYTYEMYFTNDETLVWGEFWETKPAGICGDIPPNKDCYSIIKTLETKLKIDVAQKNTCFSMQDCMDGIVALGWENIDEYTECPEERLIFRYAERINEVEQKLLINDLTFK
ncbi:MAG: hypothetical protein M0R03_16180 [Novosphingobium sp.]|nr:hypothetical protein [Novosphingobium sp.]